MKNHIFILFLLLTCVSCYDDHSDLIPDRALDGDPSGAVINANVIEVNGETLRLMLDVFVVNGRGNFVSGLSGANFDIESVRINLGDSIYFTNVNVGASRTDRKGSYSATLLLDQSGSISSTDPQNSRVEAAKIFSGALGDDDYALVSSFTSSYSNDVVIHTDYTQDTTDLYESLESLLFQEGGFTPLYRSAYKMVAYTKANAPGNNQAIILFTDGQDTEGGIFLEELTDYASSQNVQIYTIGLSRDVDFGVLAAIAGNTGGAFMWAEDTRQLITMFGTLGDLLSGNALFYQTQWQATISSGVWSSNTSLVAELVVTLTDGSQFIVPFEIVIP
jgi:hypothetical protein